MFGLKQKIFSDTNTLKFYQLKDIFPETIARKLIRDERASS